MNTRTFTLSLFTATLVANSLAQTPTLVKDINPTGSSAVFFMACFGSEVYFSATDGVNGLELWKTDGTEAGTVLVKDLNPGAGNGIPTNGFEFNGQLYFTGTDGVNGTQLWRTSGTTAGTQPVLSMADVSGLLDWSEFVPLGDRIYFRGRDAANGTELWSTDGTAAGTQLFLDINPGTSNSGIDDMIAHNGKLYFEASEPTHGAEPWTSDGTLAGTHVIAETVVGSGSPGTTPSQFFGVGDLIFFRAGTGATGDELWATDGTEAGTGLVRDIWPGTNTSFPANFIEHNGLFHFRAYPSSENLYIYSSDGTQAGTVAEPLYGYTNPDNLVSHDGEIWFTAVGGGYRQLWHSDGTEAGTAEITYPGSDVISPFSNSGPMLSCNGMLFFRANYLNAVGQELYTLNTPTGVAEDRTNNVRLYPNPASSFMSLGVSVPNASVQLFTMDGRLVLWAPGNGPLDVHSLPAGMYAAVVLDNGGNVLHRQHVAIEH